MDDRPDAALYRSLAGRLSGDADGLDDLAAACAQVLEIDDVAVQLRTNGQPASALGASGPLARVAEERQLDLGEGPTEEAQQSGRPVVSHDLRSERRWMRTTPALLDLGVRSVAAFPFRRGAVRVGSLTGYRPEAVPATDDATDRGIRVAATAMHVVLVAYRPSSNGDEATPVSDLDWLGSAAVDNRAASHQATGMVAAQLDCDVADAYARLQAYAFGNGLTVAEVADQVLERTLRFEP